MKRGVLWAIVGIIITLLLVLITIRYLPSEDLQNSPLEDCKTIKYSQEGRVNILFFAEKDQAEKYSQFLLNTYPFNQTKDQLNFYYIDTYTPECELYKETSILCYSKELIERASSCPNDYIVVLKDKNREIRSSAYMNVLSINLAHPLSVLAHEFGHTFANLADEYTPATLPRKQENCKESCTGFGELGCFNGCSKDTYFRSSSSGLMKTLSSKDYGEFDSLLILKRLENDRETLLTGKVIQEINDCSNQKYYLLEGEYLSGKIEIRNQSIQVGCVGNTGAGGFEYQIVMKDGTIGSNNFNPEIVFTDNEVGGEVYEYQGSFYLKIPKTESIKSIEIRLDNTTLSKTSLIEEDSTPCRI